MVESSKLACSLDEIVIQVNSHVKAMTEDNLKLWLKRKPSAICSGYNWSIATTDLVSVKLEEKEQKLVVIFESVQNKKVWIGELILRNEFAMTTREQQRRKRELQHFVDVILKLVAKNNSGSGMQGSSSKFLKKSSPSSNGRQGVVPKYVSPTYGCKTLVRKASTLRKKQKSFDLTEFSSDEEEPEGVKAFSHGIENTNLQRMQCNVDDKLNINEGFNAHDTFDPQPCESDSSSIEMHRSGPRHSKILQKNRKQLVLQDDEEDDDDDSVAEVDTSLTIMATSVQSITKGERPEAACSKGIGGDNENSNKTGSTGSICSISSFFKPKRNKAATVTLVSPVTVSTASPSTAGDYAAAAKLNDDTECYGKLKPEDWIGSQRRTLANPLNNTPTKRKSPVASQDSISSMKTLNMQHCVVGTATAQEPSGQSDDEEEALEDGNELVIAIQKRRFKPWSLRAKRNYQRLRDEDEDELKSETNECDAISETNNSDTFHISSHSQSSAVERRVTQDNGIMKRVYDATISEKPIVGLRNTGNTCYLNAAIQLLFSLQGGFVPDFLTFYERYAAHQKENSSGINAPALAVNSADHRTSTIGSSSVIADISLSLHHAVASVFYSLHRTSPPPFLNHLDCTAILSGSGNSASAFCIKNAVDRQTESYHGNDQRDSHEFLLEMLDLLDEEEKQAKDAQNFELQESFARLITPTKDGNSTTTSSNSFVKMEDLEHGPQTTQKIAPAAVGLPIEQYFKCELEVMLVCDLCGYSRTKSELYRHLSLDLASDAENDIQFGITRGLDMFFQSHTVSVKCDKNGCHGQTCMKSQRVVRLPGALLLHLKRFKVKEQEPIDDLKTAVGIRYVKNKGRIHCPTSLSLSPFCAFPNASEDKNGPMYRLRSIVHHIGDCANRGHYTADALRSITRNSSPSAKRPPLQPLSLNSKPTISNEKWARFDDAVTNFISEEDALCDQESMRNAYMLLYEIDKR